MSDHCFFIMHVCDITIGHIMYRRLLKNFMKHASQTLFLIIGISILIANLTSCSKSEHSPGETSESRRYELTGRIVSVDKEHRQVTIQHEEIKGFMEAMTMPFAVKDQDALNEMAEGDQIKATLVVDWGRSWIENPILTKKSPTAPEPSTSSELKEPQAGDKIPDFSFVNQDSKKGTLNQYRGQALLTTFIYTRCPLPEYCILMSNNFAEINRELQKTPELASKTHMLSISIEPSYDKPEVLRSYGEKYLGKGSTDGFKQWEFISGTDEDTKRIAEFFGLTYAPNGNQIIHSLRTAIIDPDGKVYKLYKGNEWKPADVVQDLKFLLKIK
jgi:protein SCO1